MSAVGGSSRTFACRISTWLRGEVMFRVAAPSGVRFSSPHLSAISDTSSRRATGSCFSSSSLHSFLYSLPKA